MKILQISTYDIRGGAARATYRLHRGLRNMGQSCHMLVKYKDTDDPSVSSVAEDRGADSDNTAFFMEIPIQEHYINARRTDLSNTMFSLPYPGYDVSMLERVQDADIINLHWISQFQSPITLHHLFGLNKPIVWTLHDQWAFTGGCHYSAGCTGYRSHCRECPQLSYDPFFLPEAVLRDKEDLLKNANLTIVTPSRWMGHCVEESQLFKSSTVRVIANSLETELYSPIPKSEAKKRWGIPDNAVTFLFGAIDGAEKRKGFTELVNAIKFCQQNDLFCELLRKNQVKLISFGNPNHKIESTGIPFLSLGRLKTDEDIRDAFSAADIFLFPSLEDNLPNTVLESMSCGTPVVAFNVGGVPEMVSDGVTGHLVEPFDIRQMGDKIVSLSLDPDKRRSMGNACRKRVISDYALDVQAKNYLALYEELLHESSRLAPQPPSNSRPANGVEHKALMAKKQVMAPLDTSMGSQFRGIYDSILFQALKSFSPHAHKLWRISESDRANRLSQVKNLTRLLESCETDREARLRQINELTTLLETCEADRSARLDEINRLAARKGAKIMDSMMGKDKQDMKSCQTELAHQFELQELESELQTKNSEIETLKQQLQRETRKAQKAESHWHALENTQVVRKARRLGLIRQKSIDLTIKDEKKINIE